MAQGPSDGRVGGSKPAYVAPTITVMNEDEILKTFQLTSAMSGWWAGISG